MPKATKQDLPIVIEILWKSFKDNPSATWVVKQDKKRDLRLKELCRYAVYYSYDREGVYLSSDRKAAALIYKKNFKREGIKDYLRQIRLINKAIGWDQLFNVLNREAYLNKLRPKNGNFYYFWFLGVAPEDRGQGSVINLKNEIFQQAWNERLPIYLETSVSLNKKVYERYGFETYHTWQPENKDFETWFMKRSWE